MSRPMEGKKCIKSETMGFEPTTFEPDSNESKILNLTTKLNSQFDTVAYFWRPGKWHKDDSTQFYGGTS